MTTLKQTFKKIVDDSASKRDRLVCEEWMEVALANASDGPRLFRPLFIATAACLVVVVTCGAAWVVNLKNEIEKSGIPTAMEVSISGSGRDSVEAEGMYDPRYVERVELRLLGKTLSLSDDSELSEDGIRRSFSKRIPVALDGNQFTATVEFYPKPNVAADFPNFFGEADTHKARRFLASHSGLITDPHEIFLPAELLQIVYMPDRKDKTRDQNRYVVTGRAYEQVVGMHGWLIIDPVFSSNMVVGSRLPLDGMSGSGFVGSCFLGNGEPDGEPFRLFCVFSNDPDALEIEQELVRGRVDWSQFLRTETRYKINDGSNGFDKESELDPVLK